MMKVYEISDPHSCLNKADDDEPIFVLRAQDILAPDIVDEWATRMNMAHACRAMSNETRDRLEGKIRAARKCADHMRVWAAKHGAKLPD